MTDDFPPTESSDPIPTDGTPGPIENIPTQIGRFRIERILGKGGFGVVYLAHDEQLQRDVAIKVPHPRLVQRPEDRELYLKEARTVAGLEHPNIVPVLEVGSTPEFPIYVVSKFIVGKDLATHLKSLTPTNHQAVQWMIDLADALREAHRKGFVHRDVKPQNILVDQDERVFLVDFGLALADQDVGKRLPAGGTPAYMSPEQARGEGHRVDGRSDLFSLGILFYEMLCGRRPFQGDTRLELFEQITDLDPKPLRQWLDTIPQELERICFKMLAKRKSERYSNAKDLANDLRVFVSKSPIDSHLVEPIRQPNEQTPSSNITKGANSDATPVAPIPTSGSRTLKIVPKGLRSFDHRDADFFLELLPGARDRDGLPESITFWKSRIEERDADQTFAVGLVYGPSGCGKSSMVKAGLLPRLASDIVPIYLEATVDDTEQTLLAMLRKKIGNKEADLANLADLLHEIRRGRVLPRDKKLVIVLDQFEQWLFAHSRMAGEPLLNSLLQCDGSRVQAIVMVRDDFWMAATRFFRELDIPLLERINSAAVDLFDVEHAERVLRAFGRAFGKLESEGKEDKRDRKQFITDSVLGLSEDGKVISVRLALFAEMMKGKPWTPESLREVGGTTGVGTAFLEETFSATGAPPKHRYHQEGARAILRALLPQAGTDIKGHKRSGDELQAACRYNNRQKDFDDLIRILDGELRLITPVDDTGIEGDALREGGGDFQSYLRSDEHHENGQQQSIGDAPTNRARGTEDALPSSLAIARTTPSTTAEKPTAILVPSSATCHASLAIKYQLTHDYLVPSLRDWLTRKQRETRKGRAELKLAERAATWSNKQENRQLPTLSEWLSIRTLTESKKWTFLERSVMQRASRVHGRWWGGLALVTLVLGFGIQQWIAIERRKSLQDQTRSIAESLQNTFGPGVPVNLKELGKLPKDLVLPELQTRFTSATNPRHKLSLAFALAHFGQLDVDYFVSKIDEITKSDTENFLTALRENGPVSLRSIQAESAKCGDKSLWRRKAKLAIVALNLGDTILATDVCAIEDRPDPEQRTLFIDELSRWEIRLKELHDLMSSSDNPALRSGICLGLGLIAVEKLSETDKTLWQSLASRWFVEKGDTTTHSAAGWLLRRWRIPEPIAQDHDKIVPHRDWFINSVGATMLKIRSYAPMSADLSDPLETYQKQLTQVAQLTVSELDKPDSREKRAIANYQVGNLESALEDFDWLRTHGEETRMSDISMPMTEILKYRSLALAQLGKEVEARESLKDFHDLNSFFSGSTSYGTDLEIQLPAWLGDFGEATRQVKFALNDPSSTEYDRYRIACAASRCSKAALVKNPERSKQFADQTFEILGELIRGGYGKKNRIQEDPDFANLHDDVRFGALIKELDQIPVFWVADREVSRGQFESFMNDASYPDLEKPETWDGVDMQVSPTAFHPVQQVSWYDSLMFCNWLSLREGRRPCYERTGSKVKNAENTIEEHDAWRLIPEANGYRLLREVESEYACRAGTVTPYSMGDDDETLLVSYCRMGPSKLTALCGDKIPNGWGLHDVHGNVSEWCEDFYDASSLYQKTHRVVRGGGWVQNSYFCASGFRDGRVPSKRSSELGFRVALSSSKKIED